MHTGTEISPKESSTIRPNWQMMGGSIDGLRDGAVFLVATSTDWTPGGSDSSNGEEHELISKV